MDFLKYFITNDDAGRRLDRIVRRFLPEMPLSGIYKLMRNGLVRVDGKRIKPDFHPEAGSELWISTVLAPPSRADTDVKIKKKTASTNNTAFKPDILLETEDLLFVNKCAGISVHGENGLDQYIPQSQSGSASLSFRTGPLHRIDRNTSGLVTFSRSLYGAQWFSDGIQRHVFEKYYLGICQGTLLESLEWYDDDAEQKNMITHVLPLARSATGRPPFTLVRFRIITGRKHQIRIQCAGHGSPLAGDGTYGGKSMGGSNHYFLHAWQLVFPTERPSGVPAKIVAPLPADFTSVIREIFGEYILAYIQQGDLY